MKQALSFFRKVLWLIILNTGATHATVFILSQNGGCMLEASDLISYTDEICSFCLGYLETEDDVISTPCSHLFHMHCFKHYYQHCFNHHYQKVSSSFNYTPNCPVCEQRLESIIGAAMKQTGHLSFSETNYQVTPPVAHSLTRGRAALGKYKAHNKENKEPGEGQTTAALHEYLHNAFFQLKFAYQFGSEGGIRQQAYTLLVEATRYTAGKAYKIFLTDDDPVHYHRALSESLLLFVSREIIQQRSGLNRKHQKTATPESSDIESETDSWEHQLAHIQWSIGNELYKSYQTTECEKDLTRALQYVRLAQESYQRVDGKLTTGNASLGNKITSLLREIDLSRTHAQMAAFLNKKQTGCQIFEPEEQPAWLTHSSRVCNPFGKDSYPEPESVALLQGTWPTCIPPELKQVQQRYKSLLHQAPANTTDVKVSANYTRCLIELIQIELLLLFTGEQPAGIHLYSAKRMLSEAEQHALHSTTDQNKVVYLTKIAEEIAKKRSFTTITAAHQ